jgi:UDP-N-acetyl-D-galactosamine dehydrogenase
MEFPEIHARLSRWHCIGVDPYYLTHRAERAGYRPKVILAGRDINDGVGQRIADECIRRLKARGILSGVVTILGMTFKENVPDTRNSKVVDIVRALGAAGLTVQVHDPVADAEDAKHEYAIALVTADALKPADAVIFAVAHQEFASKGWPLLQRLLRDGKGIVLDVKSKLDRARKPDGVELWRL